jgi:hypothetical protein
MSKAFWFLMHVKIDVGAPVEVPDEASSKRLRGRPTNVGHFHGYVGPEKFICIIFERTMGMLPIPSKFVEWLVPMLGRSPSSPTLCAAGG